MNNVSMHLQRLASCRPVLDAECAATPAGLSTESHRRRWMLPGVPTLQQRTVPRPQLRLDVRLSASRETSLRILPHRMWWRSNGLSRRLPGVSSGRGKRMRAQRASMRTIAFDAKTRVLASRPEAHGRQSM